jgi:hypothetical protein
VGLNNHPPSPLSLGSVAVIISSNPTNPHHTCTPTHYTPPCPALHLPFTHFIPCKPSTHLHHSHTHPPHIPQTLSPSAPQPHYTSQHPPPSHTPPIHTHKSFTHLHHSHTLPLKPLLQATFDGFNCFVYNS